MIPLSRRHALALWRHALALWHRGGASRSRSFPVRLAPFYRFSPHALRAQDGRPFGCADQAQVVGAGVGSAVTMETSNRRGPTDARILSGTCCWAPSSIGTSASWATVVGVEGCLFACDRLASATLSAQIAARKPLATRMPRAGRGGVVSMESSLPGESVYMHALSVLLV